MIDRGLNPLKSLLIVQSNADNSNGLVLASSPKSKKVLGISNVQREHDLPTEIDNPAAKYLIKAPPRMRYYIAMNLKIQKIFREFADDKDILNYSIDESLLFLDRSLNLFVPGDYPDSVKLDRIAEMIQKSIFRETGIFSTVGMSNSNPLLAKLALDNEAKKNPTMRALWNYEDVEDKVWNIKNLDDFWGIGSRMKRNLENMGIHSIKELAHASTRALKTKYGVRGMELFHHANGIDRTSFKDKKENQYAVIHNPSISNSQTLPRNYSRFEISLIIREMTEQTARRLRSKNKKAGVVTLSLGYAYGEPSGGFSRQMKISPTSITKELLNYLMILFQKHYDGSLVRRVGISYSSLTENGGNQLSLFDENLDSIREENLDKVMDLIRKKYGFVSIMRASSLLDYARSKKRSGLVAGHSGGGAGGLDGL